MEDYKQKAQQARIKVLEMIHRAGTSHIASNFSVIDIATVLYENLKEEDEVVWSKGWAAASIYYFNVQRGRTPAEALDKFPNEPYLGLAETTAPGVICNGGSVGHGLSIAVGIAYAKKLKGEQGKFYCIMSDGELNEGSTWEAVMFAAHHQLGNLVVILDANGWQAMGKTSEILNVNAESSFGGFGWHTMLLDGHDHEDIESSLDWASKKEYPTVLICDTVKGKGVSFMENSLTFHYRHVDDEIYEKALAELQ